METSREDFGIAVRSAFLKKGTQQRFSLFALIIFSIILIYIETIETKPLNYLRYLVKDIIYRGSAAVSFPYKGVKITTGAIKKHINVVNENTKLKEENNKLKEQIYDPGYLILENQQLRKLLEEQIEVDKNVISARVLLEEKSPYLNSFIINSGSNRNIKNGLAVLDGKNFIGRIVDVNFFSSRVLLITDLNSKIPVLIEPSAHHAILNGRGKNKPILEYLPKNYKIENGDKVYTSGKDGIFSPGLPIGEIIIEENIIKVLPFSDLNQVTFVNIDLGYLEKK